MAKMIVIGGGPAGVTAALRARELGADVTLVERGRMGGTCTNDGCAPTRVLAKAARLLRRCSAVRGLRAPGRASRTGLCSLDGTHAACHLSDARKETAYPPVGRCRGKCDHQCGHRSFCGCSHDLRGGWAAAVSRSVHLVRRRAGEASGFRRGRPGVHAQRRVVLEAAAALGGGRRGSRHRLPACFYIQGIWHTGHSPRSCSAHPDAGG